MSEVQGRPVWFELVAEDTDGAGRFYEALAGWSVRADPDPRHGDYRMAHASTGEPAAGLMKPPPGMAVEPGWRIYFGSDDVDGDAARIAELGGQVQFGPMDIPDVGRFLVATDPQGVAFNLMQANGFQSSAFKTQADSVHDGHGVWVELATPEPDDALDFYGRLFGWAKQGAMPMGPMGEYAFVGFDEKDCPGAVMSSTATGAPARWNWYIHVPDIDAAIERAKAACGTLFQEPTEIPGGAFSANLADAHGQQIGIVGARKERSNG